MVFIIFIICNQHLNQLKLYLNYIHPSIFYPLSGAGLWGQQPKKRSPNSHLLIQLYSDSLLNDRTSHPIAKA